MWARTLAVAGVTVRIEADDERWLDDVVAPLFGPFLLSSDRPSDTCLRVRCSPPALSTPGGWTHPLTSPDALAGLVDEHVWRALVDRSADHVILHAAGMAKHGRAVIMPGASKAGKSTLALAMAARGCDYLSDDIVPIEPATRRAIPVPRLMHLRPPTLAMLPEATRHVRHVAVPWVDADGRRVVLAAPRSVPDLAARVPLAAIVFPSRASSDASCLGALRPTLAVVRLLEHTLNRGTLAATAFAAALDLARHVPCYQLTVGNVRTAADTLVGLLAQSRDGSELAPRPGFEPGT